MENNLLYYEENAGINFVSVSVSVLMYMCNDYRCRLVKKDGLQKQCIKKIYVVFCCYVMKY